MKQAIPQQKAPLILLFTNKNKGKNIWLQKGLRSWL